MNPSSFGILAHNWLTAHNLVLVVHMSKHMMPQRSIEYSQTRLIRTLLIHFCLIRRGNLKTLKPLPLTPMLNQPFN